MDKQIIYYECVNSACNLRFPELRDGLEREHCPLCRGPVRAAMRLDPPPRESASDPGIEQPWIMEGLLDNIRSSLNVGSIFRTADGIGVCKLYLCGITPSPDNGRLEKAALGAEKNVRWEKINNGVKQARQLKANGYCLWGLETAEHADSLYSIGEITDRQLVLVAGNEVCGIDPEILELCDRVISIEMAGVKKSFNVATAFGIAASYLRHCQIFSQGSVSKLPKTRLTP